MVDDLATSADESATRPGSNRNRDIAEIYPTGRFPDETGLCKRRPRRWRIRHRPAIATRRRLRSAAALRHRCAQMADIPLHGANRMLVIHVDVIETFDVPGLRIFDQRSVGTSKVAEASLPCGLSSLFPHFEDLFLCR